MRSYVYTRELAQRCIGRCWLALLGLWGVGVLVALLALEFRWAVFAACMWAEVLTLPGALIYKIEMSQVGATVFPDAARPGPAPVAPPRAGPPPVAADKMRVHLGRDKGGLPLGIRVGARGAEHVLVVRAQNVMEAIILVAGRAGWDINAATGPSGLADLVEVCRRRSEGLPLLAPTLVVISELDEVLEGPHALGSQELHYLLAHGAAAGLHVVAATQHPALAAGRWPIRISGPLSDPGDLVLALGVTTLDEAQEMARVTGMHWLSAKGNYIEFRPEVG